MHIHNLHTQFPRASPSLELLFLYLDCIFRVENLLSAMFCVKKITQFRQDFRKLCLEVGGHT